MAKYWRTELLKRFQQLSDSRPGSQWYSTRELADAMDISVYSMRRKLLLLEAEGAVISSSQRLQGRRKSLNWRLNE
ncbi:FaeA/PapI family transcriptional regulator [Klebsiella aerogenes]|jgi:predicted ArsR family transcriptional regulator